MDSTSLTFTLQPGQPQFLCASEVQFLHCTQGALQLEWEQGGIPYQHVLHGGGMPWQPLQVPVGTWVRLSVIGTRSATLIQECSAPSVGMGTMLLDLFRQAGLAHGLNLDRKPFAYRLTSCCPTERYQRLLRKLNVLHLAWSHETIPITR